MNREEFINGLLELGISFDDSKLEKLEKYFELLTFWNEKINLTSITLKEDVYLKHFYDSLTICKVIDLNKYESFCDIGTGAGFPGIVIKIFFPHLKVTLIDSLNKRINFLNIVIDELKLNDISCVHIRAEEYASFNREIFDVVVARAVAPLNILLEYSLPLVKKDRYFIAMKGNETSNYNLALKVLNGEEVLKEEFLLPIENSKRTLIVIKKKNFTSKKYPRRFSEIKKRPL